MPSSPTSSTRSSGCREPRYRLDLHTADAETMRPAIAEALAQERPDWTLVFGDTNSTLAGTEAAGDAGVPVAHVEAGLRSGDLSMPEEHNRIAVDAAAELLLCPDERSRETLLAEGVGGPHRGRRRRDGRRVLPLRADRARALDGPQARTSSSRAATSRRRSTARRTSGPSGSRGSSTGSAGSASASSSPRTRARAPTLGEVPANVEILSPLGYLDMAALVSQARVLVTDSGGLQKEAYWYGVPVRDRAAVDRVEGHRRARRERPRRRRPRASSRPRWRRRGCPTSGRRSTATVTPPNGS